jgi:hypothetical protein
MDFMTRDASDQDTADQIIQSFRVLANNKVIILNKIHMVIEKKSYIYLFLALHNS